jgi:hypothetical protein
MFANIVSLISHEFSILICYPRIKTLDKVVGDFLGWHRTVKITQILDSLTIGYELGKDLEILGGICCDSEPILTKSFELFVLQLLCDFILFLFFESVALAEQISINETSKTKHTNSEEKVEHSMRLFGPPNCLNLLAKLSSMEVRSNTIFVVFESQVVFSPKSDLPRLLVKSLKPHDYKYLSINKNLFFLVSLKFCFGADCFI